MLFSRPRRRQRPSFFIVYRDVAQLVEYTSGGRVVARSSRVIPTNEIRGFSVSELEPLFYLHTVCI